MILMCATSLLHGHKGHIDDPENEGNWTIELVGPK